jgi:hypothetical protein
MVRRYRSAGGVDLYKIRVGNQTNQKEKEMTQVFTINGWIAFTTHLADGVVCETNGRATYQVAVDGAESREDARTKILGKQLESGSSIGSLVVRWVNDGDGVDAQDWGLTVDGRELGDDDEEEAEEWQDAVEDSGLTTTVFLGIEAILD